MIACTIRQLEFDDLTESRLNTLRSMGEQVAYQFGDKFNWKNFQLADYVCNHRFMICEKDGRIIGIMLSRLYASIFDPKVKILMQDLLFAEPGTKAAKMLMDDFLTFGKSNADHLITMITPKTNIKRRNLEKLGFKELETLYRFEV